MRAPPLNSENLVSLIPDGCLPRFQKLHGMMAVIILMSRLVMKKGRFKIIRVSRLVMKTILARMVAVRVRKILEEDLS